MSCVLTQLLRFNDVSEFNSQTQSEFLQRDERPRSCGAILPLQEFLQARRGHSRYLRFLERDRLVRSGVRVVAVRGARFGGVQTREGHHADVGQLQQAPRDVPGSQVLALGATDTFARHAGLHHRFGDAQVAVAL